MKKPHHIAESGIMDENGDSRVIYPRGLNIVWGDDQRYWDLDRNKRDGLATLVQVSWLDVSGSVEVEGRKKYRVKFEVMLKPDAFGWAGSPVLVMAKVGKRGKYRYSEIVLNDTSGNFFQIPASDDPQSSVIVDVPGDAPEPKIYFGLYEVWSGKWKGGLKISKVTVEAIANI